MNTFRFKLIRSFGKLIHICGFIKWETREVCKTYRASRSDALKPKAQPGQTEFLLCCKLVTMRDSTLNQYMYTQISMQVYTPARSGVVCIGCHSVTQNTSQKSQHKLLYRQHTNYLYFDGSWFWKKSGHVFQLVTLFFAVVTAHTKCVVTRHTKNCICTFIFPNQFLSSMISLQSCAASQKSDTPNILTARLQRFDSIVCDLCTQLIVRGT